MSDLLPGAGRLKEPSPGAAERRDRRRSLSCTVPAGTSWRGGSTDVGGSGDFGGSGDIGGSVGSGGSGDDDSEGSEDEAGLCVPPSVSVL